MGQQAGLTTRGDLFLYISTVLRKKYQRHETADSWTWLKVACGY